MVRPGRGFDGSQGQDFGEFLRRELHAAGDQIQPGADGLERIREKIQSRSSHATGRHGMMAMWGAIAAFGTQLSRYLGSRVRRVLPAGQRAPGRRAPKRPGDWHDAMLRPAFATGLAVFAIGVVLAVVPTTRSDIAHITANLSSAMSGTPASSGPGSTDGQGAAPASTSAGPSSSNFASMPSTTATCPPASDARGGEAGHVWLVRRGQLALAYRRDHQPVRVIKRERQQRRREPGAPVLPTPGTRAPAPR